VCLNMSKSDVKTEKTEQKSTGLKGGRGTHGSLTKAGKVRAQTPIIVKTNIRKRDGPSKRNRKEFYLYLTKAKDANLKPKADYSQR
jgi:ribosomal protein S30